MNKGNRKTPELFPREYKWLDDEEAKRIVIKVTTPYKNNEGKTLYILPSSQDLQNIKRLQEKWQKHLSMDFAEMFLRTEEDWEEKWINYAKEGL